MSRGKLASPGRIGVVLLAALFVVSSFGCAVVPSSKPARQLDHAAPTASILITTGFGGKVLKNKTIAFSAGDTVLDVLKKNFRVKTAYGGGFVNAIEGLQSHYTGSGSAQNDWFYYVNGVQAQVGAGEYVLRPGDNVWWDYHSWERWQFIPGVVGQFPEPFVHGHGGKAQPVEIVYEKQFEREAVALRVTLQKSTGERVSAHPLTVSPSDNRSPESWETWETDNLIVIGLWQRLARYASVKKVRPNLPVQFRGQDVVVLTENGRPRDRQADAGAVVASQRGEFGLWLVTGTSDTGVKRAVSALVRRDPALAGKVSAIVSADNKIIASPR